MTREQQVTVLLRIANAVVDAVAAGGPQGAPAGVLYAAFMPYGFSLEEFEVLMRLLIASGRLRKEGHLYFVVVEPPREKA